MRSFKVLRSLTLAASLLALTGITGCASASRDVVLHPIEREEFFKIPSGTQIGMEKTDRDGYFLSEFYMKEIARAKLDE